MPGSMREAADPVVVFVAAAIAIQLLGHYHAAEVLRWGHFYGLWAVLRIAVPLALLRYAGLTLSEAGIRLPSLNRNSALLLAGGVGLLLLAFPGVYFLKGYFAHYGGSFGGGGAASRLANFLVFTSSTLVGWELLHRGFLLFGLSHLLEKRRGVDRSTAVMIAVAVVWIFEVLFHFKKPELEAAALLAGSPALSLLGIWSGSVLPPFLIHLLVELLFIASLMLNFAG